MLIVFRKTNENDQIGVVKAFDLVGIFLGSIRNRGRMMPGTFDFKLLFKAIKTVLEGEAAFPMGTTLITQGRP